jgi:hypothetical protein
MKNVPHPSWIPAPAPEAVDAIGSDGPGGAEADASETAVASAPADPWANPVSAFRRPADKQISAPGTPRLHKTRADEAIAYLLEHGPSDGSALCKAMNITSKGGVSPFIQNALKAGRIIRADGKYMLGKDVAATPANVQPSAAKDAASAIAAMRRESAPSTSIGVSHPAAESAVERVPAAAIAPPNDASQISDVDIPHARTPVFTLTVSDAMLLSWPDGAVTVQRAGSFVELTPVQSKLFCMLAELRK